MNGGLRPREIVALSTPARSETVRVWPDVELRLLRWDGHPPGFVLIHGLASNARLWQGVSEVLCDGGTGHAVTAIDLRGHGESGVPASGYDTATSAADVAAVIGRLGLERPIVAGQSWGANVVVEIAATHRRVAGGVALVDGGWLRLRDSFATWAGVLQALTPPDLSGRSWTQISAKMRAAHPDWADWAIEATMANLRELGDGAVRNRLARDHHLSILRSMWEHSITDRFGQVDVPSLLVPAGQRAGAKLHAVQRAAAALAGSQVRWYEDADHDVHAQHPRALAADLLALAERAGLAPIETSRNGPNLS